MRDVQNNGGCKPDANMLSEVNSWLLDTLVQAQAELEDAPAEGRRAARDRYMRVLREFCDAPDCVKVRD
jgi:hypothetical protein